MKLKKSDLREMYLTMTAPALMRKLGIKSASALYRLLDKAGIERKSGEQGERAPRTYTNIKLVD